LNVAVTQAKYLAVPPGHIKRQKILFGFLANKKKIIFIGVTRKLRLTSSMTGLLFAGNLLKQPS
jgi:hypothetical protein